ncbi:MAG: TRAP transporter substrate-binding protein DctP [bacterium]|jgi:TRAP-type C4-dicarboxylate transport system substrate-binding protein|nr:TRAP transporter substrate-binding protein DctP [bacterium]
MPRRLALTVLLLLLVLGTTARAETVIKFATVAPRNSTWMTIMEQLDAEVQQATGGAVKFKFYPGGVQGDEKDVIRKMRIGQLHGGGFTGVGMGLIQPNARLLDLPYLFRSAAEVDTVLEGLFPTFATLFEEKDFILLGWAEVGFVHFFTRDPVRSLADLGRQKLWIWEGDPLAGAYFSELGLKPIPLALPDVLTSFQTGLINGAYASPYGASVLQWQSRVKYVSDPPMACAAGAVLVSRRIWEEIPAAHQATVKEIARRRLRQLTAASRHDNQAALEAFLKAGIQRVTPVSEAEARGFETIGIRVQDKLAGSLYDAALLERARVLIRARRAQP